MTFSAEMPSDRQGGRLQLSVHPDPWKPTYYQHPPGLWIVIGLVILVIALIIYLILRRRRQ